MERISYPDLPEGMFKHLLDTEEYINNSSIDFGLLEMIRLRVSQKNGCAYCVDMHHKELKKTGETELRLISLVTWEEATCYSSRERVVLKFTDALTRLDRGLLPDTVYNPLETYFTKQEICILSLCITQINTWTRLMKTFRFTPGNYKVS